MQRICRKKISLSTLQSSINAIYSSFENNIDKKINDEVFYFIEELEGIRFMHDDGEHFELVSKEIKKLNSIIDQSL